MQTKNEIFANLAEAIVNRNKYRCVVEFENGDILLVDFARNGEPFEDTSIVCVWSLQREIYEDNGNFKGVDEIEYGSFSLYVDVYNFVSSRLEQNNGDIYIEIY